MSRVERLAVLLLALCAGLPAVRAQDGNKSAAASLRPTGPVTIKADRAEWEKGGAMVYTGNVRLESGDLKLGGSRLMLKQFESGEFEARVEGEPATLDHVGIAANADGTRPPVAAKAKQLTYDSRSDIVEIVGEAVLTRGADEIQGEKVRYDVARRRIEAAGGVQIVIQPPAKKSEAAAPAPEPKDPAAPVPAVVP